MKKKSLVLRITLILSILLLVCFIAYISICMSYFNNHVLVYNVYSQDERIQVLDSFGVKDNDIINDVTLMYKKNGEKYCLRILTNDTEEFFRICVDGEVVGGHMPDLSSYKASSYQISNFENEKLELSKAFSIKLIGEGKSVYADIIVYPIDEDEYAIEIAILFPFNDFPDSIVKEHWFDDFILAQ